MTAADDHLGEDGLTEAGRQAQQDKAAAAAKVTAPPADVARADQDQAAKRDASGKFAKRAAAVDARTARTAADPPQAPAPPASEAQRTVSEAPRAAEPDGPCEPCAQHWQAVSERLERLEVQVQAIGKLVCAGVIGGAVVYFLSQRRPAAVAELPAAEAAAVPGEVLAEPEPAGV